MDADATALNSQFSSLLSPLSTLMKGLVTVMLELRNISVAAADGDGGEIINGVDLTLDAKKIYVMTGPNGGGKTSLAKAIMGVYPLSGGSILLNGEDITGKSITERANLGIGYAFQTPTRFKGLRVRELLTIASRYRSMPAGAGGTAAPGRSMPADAGEASARSKNPPAGAGEASAGISSSEADERRLFSLLVDVGLCAQDYIDRELNASFSGGELKRIEIATILARELRVALFDEPEAGIDLWSFQKLTETFKVLNETSDATIIIISHQERILKLADEVILIAGGKVAAIATPEAILGEIECKYPDCDCVNCEEREVSVGADVNRQATA